MPPPFFFVLYTHDGNIGFAPNQLSTIIFDNKVWFKLIFLWIFSISENINTKNPPVNPKLLIFDWALPEN